MTLESSGKEAAGLKPLCEAHGPMHGGSIFTSDLHEKDWVVLSTVGWLVVELTKRRHGCVANVLAWLVFRTMTLVHLARAGSPHHLVLITSAALILF